MSTARPLDRFRACVYFVVALVYVYFSRLVADVAARGFGYGGDASLLRQILCLFLLVVGFAGMGFAFQHQLTPLASMGLVRRPGAFKEFGVGTAFGWGMNICCVLPIALFGGLAISITPDLASWKMFFLDLLVLALAALATEIAYRGYVFQRLIEAIGPTSASLLMAVLFALNQIHGPASSRLGIVVAFFAGLLLSMAYLRTKALWLGWGLHFAWNASMGLLFGLPISGTVDFSPVVVSDAMGPEWLTGGNYGPEASLFAVLILIFSLFVLYRVTRDYAYQYAHPVIVPGGVPVDVPAPSQHNAPPVSAAPSGSASGLIQIQPAAPVAPPPVPTQLSSPVKTESTTTAEEGKGAPAENS